MDLVGDLLKTLDQMVNDQFESVEFKNFLAVPLTLERGRFYVIQNALYTSNRRDCWGYVQGSAPLAVKRVIWEHESDELINDPRAGMDHYALTVKQGEVIGLKAGGLREGRGARDGARVLLRLAPHRPAQSLADGLYGVAHARTAQQRQDRQRRRHVVSGRQEIRKRAWHQFKENDFPRRSRGRRHRALGKYFRDVRALREDPEDRDLVLHGARDSMAIDRAYRGALGYYMEQIH